MEKKEVIEKLIARIQERNEERFAVYKHSKQTMPAEELESILKRMHRVEELQTELGTLK